MTKRDTNDAATTPAERWRDRLHKTKQQVDVRHPNKTIRNATNQTGMQTSTPESSTRKARKGFRPG